MTKDCLTFEGKSLKIDFIAKDGENLGHLEIEMDGGIFEMPLCDAIYDCAAIDVEMGKEDNLTLDDKPVEEWTKGRRIEVRRKWR